jgi:hypothetical protein
MKGAVTGTDNQQGGDDNYRETGPISKTDQFVGGVKELAGKVTKKQGLQEAGERQRTMGEKN